MKKIIKEIEAIFNRSGLTANIEIKELNMMLELYGGEDLEVIFNTVIFISKWEIWKIVIRLNITNPELEIKQFSILGKIILKNNYKVRILMKMIKTN